MESARRRGVRTSRDESHSEECHRRMIYLSYNATQNDLFSLVSHSILVDDLRDPIQGMRAERCD